MARVPSTRNRSDQTTATNNRTTEVLESLKSELATLQEQVRVLGELQNDTRSFIAFLHMHLREAVERDEVAQARIHSLERAEGARADGLVSEMTILEDRIAYLQRKLYKAQDLERFTQLSATGEIRPWNPRWVDETMKDIDFYMKQLLLDHDNIDHFEAPNLDNDADLTALVRTILGLNPQERVSTEKVRIQLSRLSLQSVVRALTAAALCGWVFQAELPGMSLTDSVLLDEYRDHLRTRGALSYFSSCLPLYSCLLLWPCSVSPFYNSANRRQMERLPFGTWILLHTNHSSMERCSKTTYSLDKPSHSPVGCRSSFLGFSATTTT
jgi:hypothetical protein